MRALLPALFLGILTFWSGTFAGGATASGTISAHIVVLSFCLVGSARWRDPLGLGRHGRWLLPALFAVVAASWWLSPVPRAGVVGVLLLPAFLLVPAAVAACWGSPRERRFGLAALGLLLGVTAIVALFRWQVQASPRAAMPLGHHNLLAAWLVTVWPVALVPLRRGAGWRIPSALAAASAAAALAATGSFLASCAFSAQALVGAVWWRRARLWLALAVLVVWVGPAVSERVVDWWRQEPVAQSVGRPPGVPGGVERAARMAALTDTSTRARTVYAKAGWQGFKERPVLGWGVGSVAWTISRFLAPVPGVNPPSEVVGDLHSWPLQLAYETGALGLLAVAGIVLLFFRRRRGELESSSDPGLVQAALVGLGGGGLVLLGNAPAHILALPAALAVVAGAALAGSSPPRVASAKRATIGLGCVYVLPVVALLLPLDRAHVSYQRATRVADSRVALDEVRRAATLDREFPLYQARAAWLAADPGAASGEPAEEALAAARKARHLAPLWLAAGALGLEAGRPWAGEALEHARRLDPLAPLPAFHLLRARPEGPDAVELGAFAVRRDRRLGAAVFWEEYPALRDAVFARLAEADAEAAGTLAAGRTGPTLLLVQSIDVRPALSFSLFAFRRSPWPADFAAVEVRAGG